MKIMTRHISTFGLIFAALALGGCYGTYEYPQAQYLHRTDTITMSAGNAQEINAATQVIDPWRPGVGKRHIPANGARMVNAAERYHAKASGSSGPAVQGAQPGGPQGSGMTPTPPAGAAGTLPP